MYIKIYIIIFYHDCESIVGLSVDESSTELLLN